MQCDIESWKQEICVSWEQPVMIILEEELQDHLRRTTREERPAMNDPRWTTRDERPTMNDPRWHLYRCTDSQDSWDCFPNFPRISLKNKSVLVSNHFSKAVPTSARVPALVLALIPRFLSLKNPIPPKNPPFFTKKTLTSFFHSLKGIS